MNGIVGNLLIFNTQYTKVFVFATAYILKFPDVTRKKN
jgi:hypothetical protein